MSGMRLSVAMCTYNGARYLEEQLDSIAAQIRQPDELVVCDDHSTDATVEIIQTFISRAVFPVRLIKNENNLGSTKSFETAIDLCTGDIIALSDQDDVWQADKLMLIEAKFVDSPSIGLVFTDAVVVDEYLRPMGYRIWQSLGFNLADRKKIEAGKAVEVLLKRNIVTGATMAIRANFKKVFMPIPSEWAHDAWIALMVAACADLGMIPEPTIKYRQHINQQIGIKRNGFLKKLTMARGTKSNTYLNQLEKYRAAHEWLIENVEVLPGKEVALQLEDKMAHLTVRGNIPAGILPRLFSVIEELRTYRYHRYSYGWKSAVKDLIYG
ncbi:MAG: putative glycosyltransferase EpsE [Pelotomaculum sp. PtaB.Bin104]|nr:MAG: putative glycosyltransferase EpsE [Pelotomaculum sp. PtaB.Bin104]